MSATIAQERLQRATALCRERGWDALLVYGNAWRNDYLRYLTDFPILEGHGFALLTADGALRMFLELPNEAERATVEVPGVSIVCGPDLLGLLHREITALGNRRVAAAPLDLMPEAVAGRADSRLEDAGRAMLELLMVKFPGELECVRQAALMAEKGYEVFKDAARPGRAEYELVAEVEGFFRSRGCPDNFMILGSGGREVRGMHPPGERRLQVGDLVTTELTPCVQGYYAQVCRTLVIGEPSPAQQAAFSIFIDSMEAGLSVMRPGVTAAHVAAAENAVFAQHGLGAYTTSEYTRVRGHGLGLNVDTAPSLLEDVQTLLVEGMTLIVHPNTYHPEVGYMVIGDTLALRADGPELFTRTPRELISVPA